MMFLNSGIDFVRLFTHDIDLTKDYAKSFSFEEYIEYDKVAFEVGQIGST
jgi:hypothetical protein